MFLFLIPFACRSFSHTKNLSSFTKKKHSILKYSKENILPVSCWYISNIFRGFFLPPFYLSLSALQWRTNYKRQAKLYTVHTIFVHRKKGETGVWSIYFRGVLVFYETIIFFYCLVPFLWKVCGKIFWWRA